MIYIERPDLHSKTITALKKYQAEIDKLEYPDQILEAKRIWPQRKRNNPFNDIKTKLKEMCCGHIRCCYCEDSAADEIEHIWPKSFYPERTFTWSNYLYSCGPCNGPKNNEWEIFIDKNSRLERHVLTRKHGDRIVPPPNGQALMIDPTNVDPFIFLVLDLTMDNERLEFGPVDREKGTINNQIAEFTIRILRLNERGDLAKARYTAYTMYHARMVHYVKGKQEGIAKERLENMINQLKIESHPTVWHTILDYHQKGLLEKVDAELDALLLEAPEALTWI